MPNGLKIFYGHELLMYRATMAAGNRRSAWRHLERAHILGQAWPREHNYVHWLMLLYGFKIKSKREIIGQIPRLLLGGIKSWVGVIPLGNTGGADVPGLKPMEIPNDLQSMLSTFKNN